jgi:hypothetical protein
MRYACLALLAATTVASAFPQEAPPAQTECAIISRVSEPGVTSFDYDALQKPAFTVLSIKRHDALSDRCIRDAMYIVSMTKAEEAILLLVDWLEWENKSRSPYRMDSPGYKYPAIGALYSMGESAIPALLEIMAEHSAAKQLAKNARDAFMSIHSVFPGDGVRRLRAEAATAQGARRKNLNDAADAASGLWCKRLNCEKMKPAKDQKGVQ